MQCRAHRDCDLSGRIKRDIASALMAKDKFIANLMPRIPRRHFTTRLMTSAASPYA